MQSPQGALSSEIFTTAAGLLLPPPCRILKKGGGVIGSAEKPKWVRVVEDSIYTSDDEKGAANRKMIPLKDVRSVRLLEPSLSSSTRRLSSTTKTTTTTTTTVELVLTQGVRKWVFENTLHAHHWTEFLTCATATTVSNNNNNNSGSSSPDLAATIALPTTYHPKGGQAWDVSQPPLCGEYMWKHVRKKIGVITNQFWHVRWVWVSLPAQDASNSAVGPLLNLARESDGTSKKSYRLAECTYVDVMDEDDLRPLNAMTRNRRRLTHGLELHWGDGEQLRLCCESRASRATWASFLEDVTTSMDDPSQLPTHRQRPDIVAEVQERRRKRQDQLIERGLQRWAEYGEHYLAKVDGIDAPLCDYDNMEEILMPAPSGTQQDEYVEEESFWSSVFEGVIWGGCEDVVDCPDDETELRSVEEMVPQMEVRPQRRRTLAPTSGGHRGYDGERPSWYRQCITSVLSAHKQLQSKFVDKMLEKSVRKARTALPSLPLSTEILCHFKCKMLCPIGPYEANAHVILTPSYLVFVSGKSDAMPFRGHLKLSLVSAVARQVETSKGVYRRCRILEDGYHAVRHKMSTWRQRKDMTLDDVDANMLMPIFECVERANEGRERNRCASFLFDSDEAEQPQDEGLGESNENKKNSETDLTTENATCLKIYTRNMHVYTLYDFRPVSLDRADELLNSSGGGIARYTLDRPRAMHRRFLRTFYVALCNTLCMDALRSQEDGRLDVTVMVDAFPQQKQEPVRDVIPLKRSGLRCENKQQQQQPSTTTTTVARRSTRGRPRPSPPPDKPFEADSLQLTTRAVKSKDINADDL
eukprot:PhM_4_TR17497/c1_g1_i1/m.44186